MDIGGSDSLNLEWCDDEYHKELGARSRSADAETPWQISAASSAVLGVIFTTLAGDLSPWSLAVGAALGAAAGAAVGE